MWDVLYISTDPDKTTAIALFLLDNRIDYRHRTQMLNTSKTDSSDDYRDDYKVELMVILNSDQLKNLITIVTDFPDQNHYYLSIQICN